MKTYLIALTFSLSFTCSLLQAQNIKFVTDGVVEYDKTVNMYAVLSRFFPSTIRQQAVEQYKKSYPQFLVMKSSLSFAKDRTFFLPFETAVFANPYNTYAPQNNIIYTDLTTRTSTTQKSVLGDLFLIKDSVRAIKWKITDETREIAGYPCRRANAVIMDSIYVVAFYTNDIPIPGGPESFTGLPGMILQVTLPHENITWLATKITDKDVPALNPPVKGKVSTNRELRTSLGTALQRYGEAIQMYLKAFLL